LLNRRYVQTSYLIVLYVMNTGQLCRKILMFLPLLYDVISSVCHRIVISCMYCTIHVLRNYLLVDVLDGFQSPLCLKRQVNPNKRTMARVGDETY